MGQVWVALALTAFAGLATGIGSAIAFMAKRTDYRFLSVATGFSAGVMLYVSFVEILPEGGASLAAHYGEYWGRWVIVASFFGGMLVIGLIDNLIPAAENPHETHGEVEIMPLHEKAAPLADLPPVAVAPESATEGGTHDYSGDHHRLMRVGLFTALAIGIHNLPEGLATFLTALDDPTIGLAIAVAVGLHNIPEGVSVSVPIFYATGNRKRAFFYSFISGLAEPAGAAVAYLVLRLFSGGDALSFPPQFVGILLGVVAGVMVYISLDELLPTSRAYGRGHDSILGMMGGMALMALSLLLMK